MHTVIYAGNTAVSEVSRILQDDRYLQILSKLHANLPSPVCVKLSFTEQIPGKIY